MISGRSRHSSTHLQNSSQLSWRNSWQEEQFLARGATVCAIINAASEGQDAARRGGAGTSTVGVGTRPLQRQILVPAAAGKSKYPGAEKWFWVPSKKPKIFSKKKLSGRNAFLAKRPPGI